MPVYYNYGSTKATIPAGWLIEHSTLPQKKRDEFLYPKHALIVVNNFKGKNTQPDKQAHKTKKFIEQIQKIVEKDFGIKLQAEVRIF